jgi:hypothetical protein
MKKLFCNWLLILGWVLVGVLWNGDSVDTLKLYLAGTVLVVVFIALIVECDASAAYSLACLAALADYAAFDDKWFLLFIAAILIVTLAETAAVEEHLLPTWVYLTRYIVGVSVMWALLRSVAGGNGVFIVLWALIAMAIAFGIFRLEPKKVSDEQVSKRIPILVQLQALSSKLNLS